MRTMPADENNDILVSGNRVYLATSLEAVQIVAKQCAQAILGEMAYAKTQGMPYFQAIWIGSPKIPPFEAAFRKRMLAVPGVTEVLDFTTSRTGEVFNYSATLATIYGEGKISNG